MKTLIRILVAASMISAAFAQRLTEEQWRNKCAHITASNYHRYLSREWTAADYEIWRKRVYAFMVDKYGPCPAPAPPVESDTEQKLKEMERRLSDLEWRRIEQEQRDFLDID